MNAALAAELLKVRTTKTTLSLFLAMIGLVLLAVLLHGFGLPARDLAEAPNQMRVLTFGESVGTVFAALFGAMSITAEIRHGTIRPTLLGIPKRERVLAAKAVVAALIGLGFGLAATGTATLVGMAAFSARGIDRQLGGGDYLQLIVGGAGAAALWAVVGLGVGSLVRNQVTSIVGLFVWLLIIENLLIDSVPKFSRYLPGSLSQSIAGSQAGTLHSAGPALILLVAYAALALAAGTTKSVKSDFA